MQQKVELRKGLPDDLAKKISKLLRDEFPKVKSQIQGDAVRVTAKSRDELQRVIARLKDEGEGYPVALQFDELSLRWTMTSSRAGQVAAGADGVPHHPVAGAGRR